MRIEVQTTVVNNCGNTGVANSINRSSGNVTWGSIASTQRAPTLFPINGNRINWSNVSAKNYIVESKGGNMMSQSW